MGSSSKRATNLTVVVSTLLTGVASAQARQTTARSEVAGTYAVDICRDSCQPASGGRVLSRGHIILEPRTFRLASLPDRAERYFRRFTAILALGEGEGDPNACFSLTPRTSLATNAGAEPVGVTRWRWVPGDSIHLQLRRANHTAYAAWITVRGTKLVGVGRSRTWPAEEPLVDVIEGRRIGPPDRSICTRAAERRLREIER
jgi:hypothetical protein